MVPEKFYSKVFTAIPFPSMIIKPDGSDFIFVGANNAFLDMSGITKEQFGKKLFEVFPNNPDDPEVDGIQNLTASLKQVMKSGKVHEMGIQRYDIFAGETGRFKERYYKSVNAPLFDDEGDVKYIIQTVEDVTDQLPDKAYRFDLIGNWKWDVVESTVKWSDVTKEIHDVEQNYKPSPESDINFYEEGWSRDTIKEAIDNAIEKQKSFDLVLKIITAKGNKRWVRVVGRPEFEDGKCVSVLGSIQDVNAARKAQIELAETEQKLRNIIEYSTNLFYTSDADGVLTYVSPQSREFLGCEPEEALRHWTEFITEHPVNERAKEYVERSMATGEREPRYELQLRKADGRTIWVEVNEAPIVKDGEVVGIVGSLTDITERKKAEQESEQNRLLLEELAGQAWAAVWVRNAESRFVFVNEEFKSLFGLQNQQVTGKSVDELFEEETARQFKNNDMRVLNTGKPTTFEEWVITEGGNRYYKVNIFPLTGIPELENIVGGVAIDITDQKQNEEIIKNSLKEKETLLTEIHHRVKNNLAVISGLMEMQVMNSNNPEMNSQLLKATGRIKSMANIHEQLYQLNSFSKIQFSDGIRTLVKSIAKTFQTNTAIDLKFDLENVELNINQGLPCSLLINEVVTNILNHSFSGRKTGTIISRLKQQNGKIIIQIEDDGNQLPSNFEDLENQSMGLKLINLLTKQLEGEREYARKDSGTCFTLTFVKSDGKGAASSFLQRYDHTGL